MMKKFFLRLVYGIVCFLSAVSVGYAQGGVELPQDTGLPNKSLVQIISNLTNWFLKIFGFLAIISFIIAGIMYFFAAGDEAQQEKAKKQMMWSIVGVVAGLIGLVIIYAVDKMLNAQGGF